MGLINRLRASIEPSEGPLVRLLLLLSFALGITLVYIDVAARALFLEQFPAAQLPYAYLGSAVVIPVVGLVFGRLQRRVAFARLAIGVVAFLLVSLAALWAGIVLAGLSWLAFGLMIWYRLFYAFNGLLFWGLAGQLLTLRQGKRLFGIVGTGESVAGVLGYFSTPLIAGWVGTESMLLIGVAGLILSGVALVRIGRLRAVAAGQAADEPAPTAQAERAGPRRYTLLIVAVAVAAVLCYLFADYGFSAESELAFRGSAQLAGFFGVFFGAVAVLRIALRSVAVGWLLRRFGLKAGLLALPLAFALGAAAVLAGDAAGIGGAAFAMMALTRFLGSALQPSLQRAAVQLLYQPLPSRQRLALQSLIEGVIEPMATGAGSLLLIGVAAAGSLSTALVCAAILIVGVVWVGAALRLMDDYRDTLGRALARRLLEGSALSLSDASSRAVLGRTLDSGHPGEVIYVLGLLDRADPQLLADRLPGLLAHPDPQVRREVAARIGRAGDPDLRARLAAAYEGEGDPDVRARLLESMGADARAAELIARAQGDSSAKVRDAGLLSALRAGGGPAAHYAAQLRAMLAADDPADRARAARIIGRLGDGAWADELVRLFDDGDAGVRREALRSAGRRSDQATLDALLGALARPATRGPAAAALARRGEAVMPAIVAALAQPGGSPALRVSLIRICGRVRGGAAIELLCGAIGHPDSELRHAAILALRRCGFRAAGPTAQLVRAQIRTEAALALRVQAAQAAVAAADGADLLRAALEARLRWLRQCAFALLELICDPRSIRRIELHIHSPAANLRDYAQELLELHVEAELRQAIRPIIAGAGGPPAPAADSPATWLGRLIGADEPWVTPWISACALACARRAGASMAGAIAAARSSPSPLVRETAAWAAGEPLAAGLTTVEKVQILRTVGIFSATQDDVLAEVAGLLSPVDLPDGGPIFSRGDTGDSMYIIVGGEVLIHDGAHAVGRLGQHEVFGEMALLDAESRSASARAIGPATLLRLDQELFYELMDERIEVSHGVIRVLNRRLRAAVRDLAEARAAAG